MPDAPVRFFFWLCFAEPSDRGPDYYPYYLYYGYDGEALLLLTQPDYFSVLSGPDSVH